MRLHTIHGIHANKPGGRTSQLAPYFRAAGFDVFVRSYGLDLAILSGLTDWLNSRRAARLAKTIDHGDAIICHSNGAAVAWHIQNDHRELSALILNNPALDADRHFNNVGRVLCLHNAGDDVVSWSAIVPLSSWGAMGRDGYTGPAVNVVNVDCANPPDGLPRLWGHSDLFERGHLEHWGPALARELKIMVNKE